MDLELGFSEDDIDRCDNRHMYSEDYHPKDKTHRHMYSEYFHPEDKTYLKRFGKKKFRNKFQNKRSKKKKCTKHKKSLKKAGNSIRPEPVSTEGNLVKLVDYCHWMNGVIQSIESYTHDDTLEAEIKLKDYENCLLPEKLALES